MSRFVTTTKITSNTKNLSIIILATDYNVKNKQYGSRCLLPILKKTLIEYQIEVLKKSYPNAQIIYILGFDIESVVHVMKTKNVCFVENERYTTTGDARSILLGTYCAINKNLIIMDGANLFDKNAIKNLYNHQNLILCDNKRLLNNYEVGITSVDNKVENVSYGLNKKWSEVLFVCDKDYDKFIKIISNKKNEKLLFWEILNIFCNITNVYEHNNGGHIGYIHNINDIKKLEKYMND